MQISEELRQSVIRSLPEVNEISDETLRNKVIDAWAYSLGKSSFKSIDEIRASGNPDTPPLKRGTQTHHIRGVTLLAMRTCDELTEMFPELGVDRDLLIACALCHDVGKPWEFDPENQARWRDSPSAAGLAINSASGLRRPRLPDCRTTRGCRTHGRCPFGRR